MNCPYCQSEDVHKRGIRNEKQQYRCKVCDSWFSEDVTPDLIEQNVRLAKNRQKQQDINRIERKSFREFARIDNALLEYNKELIATIEKHTPKYKIIEHKADKEDVGLIVHLSDIHFNELVNLKHNKYDFSVASNRLKKFAEAIKREAKGYNVKSILVALTGDLMNSDRRVDEYLNQATNRSDATYLSYLILSQFILDLNKVANIHIACVSGNESRIKEERGYSDIVATDNYDFTIFNMLKVGLKGITFVSGDPSELVVSVAGQKILLLHGEGLEADTQKKTQQIIGKYVAQGDNVRFLLYGHVHSPYLSDYFSRSGSLVGSNDYNEKALFLVSRASQNIHLVHKDGSIDSKKIDLQIANNDGYSIVEELMAYNAKSAKKLHKPHIIHEIVI